MRSILLVVVWAAMTVPSWFHEARAQHVHAKPSPVSVSFDPAGTLWRARIAAGHVLVASSRDEGRRWGPEVRVNAAPEEFWADGENRPRILADGKGLVHVSYVQKIAGRMAGNVRYSRSLDHGRTFSAPVNVNQDGQAVSHRFQAMAMGPKGEVVFAWLDQRVEAGDTAPATSLFQARATARGDIVSESRVVRGPCHCCRVAMAVDPKGVPHAFFRHAFDGNVRDHAVVRLDRPSGLQRVSYDGWRLDGCPHHGPAMSIGPDGVRHYVWYSIVGGEARLGYARGFGESGPHATSMHFGDALLQPSRPDVLSTGREVYLAWKQFDGEHTTVLTQKSSDGGRRWSEPTVRARSRGASDHPMLSANRNRVFLSWSAEEWAHRLVPLNGE